MATHKGTVNKATVKLTAYQKDLIKSVESVKEYKSNCEVNIVMSLFKFKDLFYGLHLNVEDFSSNVWKVYFAILQDLVVNEKMESLDDVTIGMYLAKHPKLEEKYNEYGGYETLDKGSRYVKIENFEGYVADLKKWIVVEDLMKRGFLLANRLPDYVDMSEEEIYEELEAVLNHSFVSIGSNIKSHNVMEGMQGFIEQLDKGKQVGMPLSSELISNEISGLQKGHIYGIGAASGVGKSSLTFLWLIPSIIKYEKQVVYIINEENEDRMRLDLLVWTANNIFKEDLQKYQVRNGHYTPELRELLIKCAKWVEEKKEQKLITIIPLERYTVDTVVKIIRKYSALGVDMFVLDTFKESANAKTDRIFDSMTRDAKTLYDTIKSVACNVCLILTYQLSKGSTKTYHLTMADIGQAKSIVDVFSVNLMIRKPHESELEGGSNELVCYRLEGKNGSTKLPFKLSKDKRYLITFIAKSRFGAEGLFQIVSEVDLSRNTIKDLGITNVKEDW